MKLSANITDEKVREEYVSKIFSKEGCEIIENYAKNLAKLYFEKKSEDYPFKFGLVLGIPYFNFAHNITSPSEILERIKVLLQLLGKDKLIVDYKGCEKLIEFKEVNK